MTSRPAGELAGPTGAQGGDGIRWPWGGPGLGDEVPWPLWAGHLAARLDLDPAAAGRAAAAVALLAAGSAPAGGDALAGAARALALLRPVGPAAPLEAWLISLGEHEAEAWPEGPAVGPVRGAALPAPACPLARAAAATWSISPLLAGRDPGPWAGFGRRIAPLVDMVRALAQTWLDPAPPGLDPPRLDPEARLALSRDAALLREWAGAGEPRAERVRRALAADPCQDALAAWWAEAVALARGQVPTGGVELCEEFLGGLGRCFDWLASYARFRGLVEVGGRGPRDHDEARAALNLAREHLEAAAGWQESWEVRRRGLGGAGELLVGSWFHRGFVLRALAEMGAEVGAGVTALLAEGEPGALRWYGPWAGIPPDTDSLGIALELASLDGVGVARERVEAWLEPLLASAGPGGLVPTWLELDRAGPTTDAGALRYRGGDCTAVRLGLLNGLVCHDPRRFADLIAANLADLVRRAGPDGLDGVVFYSQAYAAQLFLRLARRYLAAAGDAPLARSVRAAADAIADRTARAQRLDGSWGGPQETGFCLAGLARWGGEGADLARGARFLAETQRPDGSWPAEPFYLMPGTSSAPLWHLGRALTTAVCGGALALAAGRDGGERR